MWAISLKQKEIDVLKRIVEEQRKVCVYGGSDALISGLREAKNTAQATLSSMLLDSRHRPILKAFELLVAKYGVYSFLL